MEPTGTPLPREQRVFTPEQFKIDLARGVDNWLRSAMNANGQYPTHEAMQKMLEQSGIQSAIDNLTAHFRQMQADGEFQNPPEVN